MSDDDLTTLTVEIEGMAAYLSVITGDPHGEWVAALRMAVAAGVTLDAVSAWASACLTGGHGLSPAHLGAMIGAARSVGNRPITRYGIHVKPGQIRDLLKGGGDQP